MQTPKGLSDASFYRHTEILYASIVLRLNMSPLKTHTPASVGVDSMKLK